MNDTKDASPAEACRSSDFQINRDAAAARNLPVRLAVLVGPWLMVMLRAAGGITIIIGCLEVGIEVQHLGFPAPGSVIGMALLLVLLKSQIVSEAWVRGPCAWLLLLLPALFVPLYVVPLADPGFWARYGLTLLPVATAGAAITLGIAGWLAWRVGPR